MVVQADREDDRLMGDKAFILAGLICGWVFGLVHGMTSPKKQFICAVIGLAVGICVYLFIDSFSPIHTK